MASNPTILFRHCRDTLEEFEVAKTCFNTVDLRSRVPVMSTVIGRYSCLPYYLELERDLATHQSRLINSAVQHFYIANMDWIDDAAEFTFRTWNKLIEVPENIPLVVKGRTNSRKFEWDSKMMAPSKMMAAKISSDLMNDPLIGQQGLVYREYVPLETFEIGLNGMPMTNEWRCFFLGDKLVDYGYYWTSLDDLSKAEQAKPDFEEFGLPFAKKVAHFIAENTNFFVLDIAKTASGKWILVEVNDGQMSGLSDIPAERFYLNLKSQIADWKGS